MSAIPIPRFSALAEFEARHPRLAGDLRGGFASALVGLPYALTVGWLALSPLGPGYAVLGMFAGIVSSVVACLVASVYTGTPCQINGPRASVGLLTAGLVASLATHPAFATTEGPDALRVLGAVMICLMAAGLLQLLLGALRFGTWVQFIPYPVIAGFMVGVGILVAAPQVPTLLGHVGAGWREAIADIRIGDLLCGVVAIGTMSLVNWRLGQVPAPILGVLSGTAFHYLVLPLLGLPGGATVGGEVSPAQLLLPWSAPQMNLSADMLGVVVALAPAIATLALVGSVEALLSSSVLDIVADTRHDSNRELVAQGLCNLAAAAAGGVASAGAPFRGVANYNAGGRTPASSAYHAVILLALAAAAMPLILLVPMAVWAGVLVMVGYAIFDAWRRRLQVFAREEIAVGLLVAGIALAFGSVPATAAGFVAAMLLYVRNMSRSIVRRTQDARTRRSLRVRPREHAAYLETHGATVQVVELQGSLFFGTASRFARAIEEQAGAARVLILDFRRIAEVDPTGAQTLHQLARRIAASGRRLVLAGITPSGRRGRVLGVAGVGGAIPEEYWFADAEAALEWAERELLREGFPALADDRELPLAEMDICNGLSPREIQVFAGYLTRESYPRGTVLFREGDEGRALYLIARGAIAVRVVLAHKEGRRRWLGTYTAGVAVGEMAVLERKNRSAEATCEEDTVVLALSDVNLARLWADHPAVHGRVMLNFTRQLAARLRSTTEQLRAALG